MKKLFIAARRVVIGLTAVVAWSVSSAQATDIKRVVSARGIEAWLVQDASIPVISFNFAWRAGAAYEQVSTFPGAHP